MSTARLKSRSLEKTSSSFSSSYALEYEQLALPSVTAIAPASGRQAQVRGGGAPVCRSRQLPGAHLLRSGQDF